MRTHGRRHIVKQSGFSMIELMISMGVMMAVTAGIFSLMNPVNGTFRSQPEVQDLQERLRVGADRIQRDLETGGAGTYAAGKFALVPSAAGTPFPGSGAGSLKFYMPAVFPRRAGLYLPDSPTTVRDDVITIIGVPTTRTQSMVWWGNGMLNTAAPLTVAWTVGCALSDPACGFQVGERAMAYDDNDNWDLFTVTSAVDGGCPNMCGNYFTTAAIGHSPANLTFPYFPQASVVGIQANTYFYCGPAGQDPKATCAGHANQLVHNDGFTAADDVVLDNVIRTKFEYFGEADPPQIIVEPSNATVFYYGLAGSWTTYGPMPPMQGQTGVGCFNNPPGTAPNCQAGASVFSWNPGENCAFTINAQGKHLPRLPELNESQNTVSSTPSQIVPLNDSGPSPVNPGIFTDGPWCPSPTSPNRFDADMLRVRKVRVTLRLQAALASLRGPAGLLFTNGGTASGGNMVPDQEIRFDVALRNFSFGR
jgi:hypothetical protein